MMDPHPKNDAAPGATRASVNDPNTATNQIRLLPPIGVSHEAWRSLASEHTHPAHGECWAIKERNAEGEVIGTAYRTPSGGKYTEKGGKRGLILAWPLSNYAGSGESDPVWVCEGASDTAAMMMLGFDTVGVPMAGQCGEMLAALLAGRHAVLCRDNDSAGLIGSNKIRDAILVTCASVRIIAPPGGAKDVREAVIAGATTADFIAAIEAAEVSRPVPSPIDGAPVIVRLAEVKPEPVAWLWPGRIAIGKLTLIAGDPGLGKSFLTLDMASRVSQGGAWPDVPGVEMSQGGVVLLNAEDGVDDTIIPRLHAAGANMDRIVALAAIRSVGRHGRASERTFDLSRDLSALEQAIQSVKGCRLVVIDPMTAYLGGVDSHKNAEIRGLIAPLTAIAEQHRVAMVAVTHLNKSGGGPAIYRAMGSLGFAAAARAVWAVTKDRDDPRRRLLLPIKNNLAPDAEGLAYRIEPGGVNGCPAVAWERAPVKVSADEALSGGKDECGKRTERDDAAAWLVALLANGPVLCKDVQKEAEDAGHAWGTVRRAKAQLQVGSRKRGFNGPHEWHLPDDPAEDAQALKELNEDVHTSASAHLVAKQAEFEQKATKMLTDGGLNALGQGERFVGLVRGTFEDGGIG